MPHFDDLAITLRRHDYSETSQVLVLFGRTTGKIRLIAKGVKRGTRKRYATGIDLLEMGHLVFAERQERQADLATLVEWRQTTIFPGLRADLPRLYGGQYLAETTARLTEERDPHQALFDGLAATLRALETTPHTLPQVVGYQVCLLTEIGLFPDLSRCAACARPWKREPDWYFTSHQGGLLCRNCESVAVEKRRAGHGAVELLAALAAGSTTRKAEPSNWRGGFDLLDYHLTHLMGRPAATSEYILPQRTRRTMT